MRAGGKRFGGGKGGRGRAALVAGGLGCLAGLLLIQAFALPRGAGLTQRVLGMYFHGVSMYVPEPEEEEEPTPMPQEPEYEDAGRITIDRADVEMDVGDEIRFELLKEPDAAGDIDLDGKEPRILIYHTHTTEAYAQVKGAKYKESGDWRTRENDKNIVAVGEVITKRLREKYGLSVLHDTTDHEPPKLGTAYSRSVETMKRYKEEYPGITMFIDVHRDAGKFRNEGGDYVVIDGKPVARMMFVVGTGEGATGTGFDEMPDFAANYALAKRMTEQLNQIHPLLMRNIRVKTGRYNQHISDQCLLIEVGHNINTLEDALNAAELFADALAQVAGAAG